MSGPFSSRAPDPASRWQRENEGLEFDRISFFTDAVFAIAMTLLTVGIAVPSLRDSSSADDMLHALRTKLPQFVAFLIGFAVLGSYWRANHRFTSHLAAVEPGYLGLGIVYLLFVAWLPFPTALLGRYVDNPIAVSLFALSSGCLSAVEALLLRRGSRVGLFRRPLPPDVYRHALQASLVPVVVFVLSVPLAFVASWLAIGFWFSSIAAQGLIARRKPADFDAYWG